MKTQTIETFDQFVDLRDEWNALLAASTTDCVFLTHEWLSVWWKHLAERRRLSILALRKDGELVGILPLAEQPARITRMMPSCLELLGSGVIGSDYLDSLVRPGYEEDASAAFATHLDDRAVMLQLSQLRDAH